MAPPIFHDVRFSANPPPTRPDGQNCFELRFRRNSANNVNWKIPFFDEKQLASTLRIFQKAKGTQFGPAKTTDDWMTGQTWQIHPPIVACAWYVHMPNCPDGNACANLRNFKQQMNLSFPRCNIRHVMPILPKTSQQQNNMGIIPVRARQQEYPKTCRTHYGACAGKARPHKVEFAPVDKNISAIKHGKGLNQIQGMTVPICHFLSWRTPQGGETPRVHLRELSACPTAPMMHLLTWSRERQPPSTNTNILLIYTPGGCPALSLLMLWGPKWLCTLYYLEINFPIAQDICYTRLAGRNYVV